MVDPDNMGICIWSNIVKLVKQQHQQLSLKEWSCPQCTLLNNASLKKCTICQGNRPVVQVPPSPKKKPMSNIKLYHFNGIDGTGKAQAACCRINITRLGDGVSMPSEGGESRKRGLREVIWTMWPDSIVEYPGKKDPKIS